MMSSTGLAGPNKLLSCFPAGGKPIDLGSWLKLIGKGHAKRGRPRGAGQWKPGKHGSRGRTPCRQASGGEFGLTMFASIW